MPDSSRKLDGPPSTLGLYGRAAAGSLPLAGRLPFFAGGGGLGEQIYSSKAGTGGIFFQSNVVVAGGLAVLLAAVGDLLILGFQRLALPWRRVAT